MDFADGLSGIGVKQHATPSSQRAQFGDRLHDSGLIVGGHDAEQHGIGCQDVFDSVELDDAVRVGPDVGHSDPVTFQAMAGVKHRLVLGLYGHDLGRSPGL